MTVTLFASGDSRTSAKLIPGVGKLCGWIPDVREHIPVSLADDGAGQAARPSFDILHFHTDLVHFPVFSGTGNPTLTTLHGRQDLFELPDFYKSFPTCRWFRSRMPSASPFPTRLLRAPFSMACRPTCFRRP
jgi:hypothetical protein